MTVYDYLFGTVVSAIVTIGENVMSTERCDYFDVHNIVECKVCGFLKARMFSEQQATFVLGITELAIGSVL